MNSKNILYKPKPFLCVRWAYSRLHVDLSKCDNLMYSQLLFFALWVLIMRWMNIHLNKIHKYFISIKKFSCDNTYVPIFYGGGDV